MSDAYVDTMRPQTVGEEIANGLSHGIGLLLAIAAIPILVVQAADHSSAAEVAGVSIFGATMVLAYLCSAIYHVLPAGNRKELMRLLDHGAIFLLIAGTYTPFTLGALSGAWGWTLFGIVWGLALMGLVLKTCMGTSLRYQNLSVALYLAMGWLVLIAIRPLYLHVPAWGLFWLVLGGLAYTLGVIFFVLDEKVRYAHAAWHIFVLAGTFCHFLAVLWYAG